MCNEYIGETTSVIYLAIECCLGTAEQAEYYEETKVDLIQNNVEYIILRVFNYDL